MLQDTVCVTTTTPSNFLETNPAETNNHLSKKGCHNKKNTTVCKEGVGNAVQLLNTGYSQKTPLYCIAVFS